MTFKVGDRVKFIHKKDKLMKIKKGDEGTVVKLEDGGDYKIVRVNFDDNKRKAIGVCDYEIERVGPKTKEVPARKVRLKDKVVFFDTPTEDFVTMVVTKLSYSHISDTISLNGFSVKDNDLEYCLIRYPEDLVDTLQEGK